MIFINKYNKYYYEKYALLSVCQLLNFDHKEFEHSDKPDLQSQRYQIGIEVVRAITEHDGLTDKLVQTYFGKGLFGDEIVEAINQNNTKGKFKGSVYSINGIGIISPTKGLYDMSIHRKLIIEKINQKSCKFQNYKHFKTNGLYCFAGTELLDFDLPPIIDACEKSVFSIVFINCTDTILQWNSSSGTLITHEIPTEYLKAWKSIVHEKNQI